MRNLLVILGLCCFIAAPVLADEIYRAKLPINRFQGADQGNVGSCQAEAEIAALESAFREKGYNVRLSSFYRHARIFQKRIESEPAKKEEHLKSGKVRYNAEDIALLNKLGDLVPYYMLPDDTTGYRPRASGVRPNISKVLVSDPEFTSVSLKRNVFTFRAGFQNSSSLAHLKSLVKSGQAVTLSFDPPLIEGDRYFNHKTGLLKPGVGIQDVKYEGATHGAAVVGFDDSLYADSGFSTPGAIIIKNSWNESDRRMQALGYQGSNVEVTNGLKQMRFKLSPGQNLPGYYAIPYEFINMIVSRNQEIGFTSLELNFDAFAKQYAMLEPRYRVVVAPYICGPAFPNFDSNNSAARKIVFEHGKLYADLLNHRASLNSSVANQKLSDMLKVQLRPRDGSGGIRQFQYAYFSQHLQTNVDRVRDFYKGIFNDYYCFSGTQGEFNHPDYLYPHSGFYNLAEFRENLISLSKNPRSSANWSELLRTLYLKEYYGGIPVIDL